MATFVKFECFSEDVAKKVHDLHNDTLKVMLTNVAPNAATNTVKADITEISSGNGYPAGGSDTQNVVSRTGGTTSIIGTDVTITAGPADVGPFWYEVLYNSTPAAGPLIGYWDRGVATTLNGANGDQFLSDFGPTLFTLA
jgi:hypothetical protein